MADDIHQRTLTWLKANQDKGYADFMRGLIPTLPPQTIIGVRTPALRQYAGHLRHDPHIDQFLAGAPHPYFEQQQLHAIIINSCRDDVIALLDEFLPTVDNWATCDILAPEIFTTNKQLVRDHVQQWVADEWPYTVRFGIGMAMRHMLRGDDYRHDVLDMVAARRHDHYYVMMMIAWFFATALALQWDDAIEYLQNHRLDRWTHNKTISKAIDSRRVPGDHKQYLRTLRR